MANGRARRLRPDVGLFVAAEDRSDESLADLAALVAPGETVGMVETDRWPLAPRLELRSEATIVQMVADTVTGGRPYPGAVPLSSADAPAMLALADLTRPGPFFSGTWQLGGFVGVWSDGALVAMAGTRLSLPGYVEVSGVCTHPDWRGRGIAAGLIRHVASAIVDNGDRAFLTSYTHNVAANALYARLGFRARAEFAFVTLERV